ncbi:MAG: hypothetical protein ISR84_00050 [Kiritimatiellales bacterium]|nr:hypothetical protein [Kiritimatiellota bacterium]MBL7015928.1 hypothetical protein [Kiritimatiellales bacterium]
MKLLDRIRQEDVAGLDFHHDHIVASHFITTPDGPRLNKLAVGQYESGMTDREMAAEIRAFWKKEKLPTRTVCTCLHSQALVIRYFNYKNLSMDELPPVLALEAEEALQCDSANIAMDWELNQTSAQPSGLSGTLFAAPQKTITRHLNLIKAAGLYSIRVEASCSALSNLYSFLNKNSQTRPVCLVSLNEWTADIVMCSNEGAYPRSVFSADKQWKDNQDYLLENIQNALLYYHLKLKNPPIEQILLIGKISQMNDFQKKLSQQTALTVTRLNVTDNPLLQFSQPEPGYQQDWNCNLATSIGLGLRKEDYELV